MIRPTTRMLRPVVLEQRSLRAHTGSVAVGPVNRMDRRAHIHAVATPVRTMAAHTIYFRRNVIPGFRKGPLGPFFGKSFGLLDWKSIQLDLNDGTWLSDSVSLPLRSRLWLWPLRGLRSGPSAVCLGSIFVGESSLFEMNHNFWRK